MRRTSGVCVLFACSKIIWNSTCYLLGCVPYHWKLTQRAGAYICRRAERTDNPELSSRESRSLPDPTTIFFLTHLNTNDPHNPEPWKSPGGGGMIACLGKPANTKILKLIILTKPHSGDVGDKSRNCRTVELDYGGGFIRPSLS